MLFCDIVRSYVHDRVASRFRRHLSSAYEPVLTAQTLAPSGLRATPAEEIAEMEVQIPPVAKIEDCRRLCGRTK